MKYNLKKRNQLKEGDISCKCYSKNVNNLFENNKVKEINKGILKNRNGNILVSFSIICFIIAIILFGFSMIIENAIKQSKNNSNNHESSSIENNSSSSLEKVDKTYNIYQDDNFLVRIIDYEYNDILDTIKVKIYIENNSDIDTHFTIDGDVSIDGFMVDGGYFYQEVSAKTKATETFSLYNLEDKGIIGNQAKEMKFKFDIYQSSNYIIKNRILDDGQVVYEFK